MILLQRDAGSLVGEDHAALIGDHDVVRDPVDDGLDLQTIAPTTLPLCLSSGMRGTATRLV